jgi:hypothetical protein
MVGVSLALSFATERGFFSIIPFIMGRKKTAIACESLSNAGSEVIDGLPNALIEVDPRLPTED